MKSSPVTWAIVLTSLVVFGCDSNTSPSSVADPTGTSNAFELGLYSPSNLLNPGPACTGGRSPGFYCRIRDREHPQVDPGEFETLADEAAITLGSVDAFNEITIAEAVCIRGNRLPDDQLIRQLATLAMNLAANLISLDTQLTDPTYSTVGDALAQAILVANDPTADRQARNEIKDVLDDINNNVNTVLDDECIGEL
jgi:hypothetical protein